MSVESEAEEEERDGAFMELKGITWGSRCGTHVLDRDGKKRLPTDQSTIFFFSPLGLVGPTWARPHVPPQNRPFYFTI